MHTIRLIATVFLSTGLLVVDNRVVLTGQAKSQQLLLAQVQPPPKPMTPKSVIDILFTTKQIQADWFAHTFLAQIPVFQLQQIVTNLKSELGTYQGVQEDN